MASQPPAVQGTSLKGKAAAQSIQLGTSSGSKAGNLKPKFQGKKGNDPKPAKLNTKQ